MENLKLSNKIVSIASLSYSYNEKAQALNNINMSVYKGETIVVMGKNGAGKSTLCNLLTGFLESNAVSYINRKSKWGFVTDNPQFNNKIKGLQLLQITSRMFNEDTQDIKSLCEQIDFDFSLLNKTPNTYSLGNKKKFAIIQNLLIKPDIIVLDEPLSSIDPSSIQKIITLLLEIKKSRQITLIITAHLVKYYDVLVDRVIVLNKGHLKLDNSLKELNDKYVIVKRPAHHKCNSDITIDGQKYCLQSKKDCPDDVSIQKLNLESIFQIWGN